MTLMELDGMNSLVFVDLGILRSNGEEGEDGRAQTGQVEMRPGKIGRNGTNEILKALNSPSIFQMAPLFA